MFDKKNVKWQEIQVNGVFRGLNDRKSWSKMFYHEVNKVPFGKPNKLNNINRFQQSSKKDLTTTSTLIPIEFSNKSLQMALNYSFDRITC